MRLPGGEHAIVDIAKLSGYCLNVQHPRGRHKARVFASVLGVTDREAEVLRRALLRAAVENEAVLTELDDYGQRYVIDCEMVGPRGPAKIRSNWIMLKGQTAPRLTSCYVL